MFFSIGMLEVVLTVTMAIPAILLFGRHYSLAKWFAVATACSLIASMLTPADVASTLPFGVALFFCYFVGTKQRRSNSPIVA